MVIQRDDTIGIIKRMKIKFSNGFPESDKVCMMP
jgi:hypothetical protein